EGRTQGSERSHVTVPSPSHVRTRGRAARRHDGLLQHRHAHGSRLGCLTSHRPARRRAMEVSVKQTILVVDILCVLITLLIAFFTYRQGTLFTKPWNLLLLAPVA